jgi:cyclohexyl-isocyanide hydratase
MTIHIGMLLYPGLTQLDLTGPLEVLVRVPHARVHLLWKTRDPVVADSGIAILPSGTLADGPQLDVVFVPGGGGVTALLDDEEGLAFLRAQGERARFVTSVCTGSLLLGAAGLLGGYDAVTHWAFMDLLPMVGERPTRRRVVVDRNRVTGAGVTSGIDFALRLAAELSDEATARAIQLAIEYDPEPPYGGHPDRADPATVAAVSQRFQRTHEARTAKLKAGRRYPNG